MCTTSSSWRILTTVDNKFGYLNLRPTQPIEVIHNDLTMLPEFVTNALGGTLSKDRTLKRLLGEYFSYYTLSG